MNLYTLRTNNLQEHTIFKCLKPPSKYNQSNLNCSPPLSHCLKPFRSISNGLSSNITIKRYSPWYSPKLFSTFWPITIISKSWFLTRQRYNMAKSKANPSRANIYSWHILSSSLSDLLAIWLANDGIDISRVMISLRRRSIRIPPM